jgi:hypothetical protein
MDEWQSFRGKKFVCAERREFQLYYDPNHTVQNYAFGRFFDNHPFVWTGHEFDTAVPMLWNPEFAKMSTDDLIYLFGRDPEIK